MAYRLALLGVAGLFAMGGSGDVGQFFWVFVIPVAIFLLILDLVELSHNAPQ